MYYINNCHCCGEYMDKTGYLYCSVECEIAIEDDNYCCYNNTVNKKNINVPEECLICFNAGRARSDTIPPVVERVNRFYYLTGYDGTSAHERYRYGISTFRKAEDYSIKHKISLLESFLLLIDIDCYHPTSYAERNNYKCTYQNCVYRKFRGPIRELIDNLSSDDLADLTQYAEDHGIYLEVAFQDQHVCRTCKNDVVPQTFGPSHQFCSARCEVIYDTRPFNDSCSTCEGRNKNCPMCNGDVYYLCREIAKKEKKVNTPVLGALNALQDLKVYNQLDDTLRDFVEYIG